MTGDGGVLSALAVSARHQVLIYLMEWKFSLVLGVVQPAVLLLVNLSSVTDPAAAGRVVLGVVLMSFWTSTVWNGAGILRLERAEGVLAASLYSCRSALVVLVGKSFGSSLLAVVSVLLTVSLSLAALGQPISVGSPGWLLLGLLVVLLSGTALGVLLSCVFLVSRFGAQISGALMYPVFLLAGLLIPLRMIPRELGALSWIVSFRWAMAFLESCTAGRPALADLGVTVLLSLGYAALGHYAFGYVSRRARVAGTLDLE
ncbi:ABC transporter permease [Kitasatospora viridis]|uniref:ABC-2 type transport system permease protein n=1 Tax=Kitasatospora viridis TaxID=281105 RepID=A0A561TSU2_9ACTN|nr:ABC transporter permease [Kitasatospora viridis]TWF90178.1 ABC-2 type transport system permease protein [Kitasatospora viridis]